MVYRDFFVNNESFSSKENKAEIEEDKGINAPITLLSDIGADTKLHPGDIIMNKGNIVGIQSIRKSLTGGETLDLVNRNGKNKVVPKDSLDSIIVIKAGNKLNESSLDKIPLDECDCEDADDSKKEASIVRIGASYDRVKDVLSKDDSKDTDKDSDKNETLSDKAIANKLQSISVAINDILECMKKNSLNRSGMSSYRVNTI